MLSQKNHTYVPVAFANEVELLDFEAHLKDRDIVHRRYFYPSLDRLGYLKSEQVFESARDIASRILCLLIDPGLDGKYLQEILC